MGNVRTDEYFHYVRKQNKSYFEAQSLCNEWFPGSSLAHPSTERQWNAIISEIRNGFWWIDLKRSSINENFTWSDGREFTYKLKNGIRDRHVSGNNCVVLKKFEKLNAFALPCTQTGPKLHIICQKKAFSARTTTIPILEAETTTPIHTTPSQSDEISPFHTTPVFYVAIFFPTILLFLILCLVLLKFYRPQKPARRESAQVTSLTEHPSTSVTQVDPLEDRYGYVLPNPAPFQTDRIPALDIESRQPRAGIMLRNQETAQNAYEAAEEPRYLSMIPESVRGSNETTESAYHYIEGSFQARDERMGTSSSAIKVQVVYENPYLN